MIEQAKYTYSPLGKALDKQIKRIEGKGKKQIKAIKNHGKQMVKIIVKNYFNIHREISN